MCLYDCIMYSVSYVSALCMCIACVLHVCCVFYVCDMCAFVSVTYLFFMCLICPCCVPVISMCYLSVLHVCVACQCYMSVLYVCLVYLLCVFNVVVFVNACPMFGGNYIEHYC